MTNRPPPNPAIALDPAAVRTALVDLLTPTVVQQRDESHHPPDVSHMS